MSPRQSIACCLFVLVACSKTPPGPSPAPEPTPSQPAPSAPAAAASIGPAATPSIAPPSVSAASTVGWKHQTFTKKECTFTFDAPETLKNVTSDPNVIPITLEGAEVTLALFLGSQLSDVIPRQTGDTELFAGPSTEQLQYVRQKPGTLDFGVQGYGREVPTEKRELGCAFMCNAKSAAVGLAFCKSIRITVK